MQAYMCIHMHIFLAFGRLTTGGHALLLETAKHTEQSNINKKYLDWQIGVGWEKRFLQ